MSGRKRKKRQQSKHFPGSGRREKAAKPEKRSIAKIVTAWLSVHRPIVLFLLIFGVLIGLFYAFILLSPFYEKHFFTPYLHLNARVSGAILASFGHNIAVAGNSISSPDFSIGVNRGCDAIEPIALFVCAVLAFPAPFLRKILGIIVGAILLSILNIARIITLFVVGIYLPRAFDLMHVDVWQGLFIFLAIVFWVFWLLWTGKSQVPVQNS